MNFEIGDRVRIGKNDVFSEHVYSGMIGKISMIYDAEVDVKLSSSSAEVIRKINSLTGKKWVVEPTIKQKFLTRAILQNGETE